MTHAYLQIARGYSYSRRHSHAHTHPRIIHRSSHRFRRGTGTNLILSARFYGSTQCAPWQSLRPIFKSEKIFFHPPPLYKKGTFPHCGKVPFSLFQNYTIPHGLFEESNHTYTKALFGFYSFSPILSLFKMFY